VRVAQVGVRELTAASRTLQPSITDFQGAVMIADVKGFTQLTEILSKTGVRQRCRQCPQGHLHHLPCKVEVVML